MQMLFGIVGFIFSALLAIYAIAGGIVFLLPQNQDPPLPVGLMADIWEDTVLYVGLAAVLFVVSILVLISANKKRGQTNA